jgi:hypothetical protein
VGGVIVISAVALTITGERAVPVAGDLPARDERAELPTTAAISSQVAGRRRAQAR